MSASTMMDLAALLAPIRADAPAGDELSQLADYETIRREVDKLDDPRGEPPDPALVEALALDLLQRGKDLRIACYLAWARHRRGGTAGLVDGITLVRGLLDTFGRQVHPTRERARRSALAWLLERLEAIEPHEERSALVAALVGLQHAAQGALRDGSPSFDALIRRLSCAAPTELQATPDEPVHVATPTPSHVATPTPSPSPPDDLTVPLDNLADRRACLARAGYLLRALARRGLEDDLADPRSYRLLRVAGSLHWDAPPAASERGRTELDPPSSRRFRELDNARQASAWRDVVMISEDMLAQQPLWLDGHLVTAQALAALGGAYEAARIVVMREARMLYGRLGGLDRLAFADGTALGSPEACRWLRSADTAAGSPNEPARKEGPRVGEGGTPLVARVVAGDEAARQMFERTITRSRSTRRAFQLRLALAHALETDGQLAAAARMYAGLERDLDAFRIDLWEPELARAVVLGLCRTLPAITPRGTSHPDLVRVGARAAQLAPMSCL